MQDVKELNLSVGDLVTVVNNRASSPQDASFVLGIFLGRAGLHVTRRRSDDGPQLSSDGTVLHLSHRRKGGGTLLRYSRPKSWSHT